LFSVEIENEDDTHCYMQCDMPLFAKWRKAAFFATGRPLERDWLPVALRLASEWKPMGR